MMDYDAIGEQPEKYLRSIGTVFAEFGGSQRSSENVLFWTPPVLRDAFCMRANSIIALAQAVSNPILEMKGLRKPATVQIHALLHDRQQRADSMSLNHKRLS
jgi:hypothetical protein